MIIQIIRYRSGLEHREVERRFAERSDRYRNVPGLVQKYYVKFAATGEYGGIYVWESPQALEAWQAGNLSGTLARTYEIEGEPGRELAEVMLVLRSG